MTAGGQPSPDEPGPRRGREPGAEGGGVGSLGRIARNTALRSGGELVAKVASLAFFVAVARELGQDGFGDFTFALSLTTVLLLAAGFGTEELIARELARDRSLIHGHLSNIAVVKAFTALLLLLVAAVIVNVGGYPSDTRVAVYVIGLGVAIENFGRTWHAVFQGYERMGLVSASIILQRGLTAVVGIAVLAAGGGLIAVSVVFAAGAAAGLAAGSWLLRRFVVVPRWEIDRSRWLPLMGAAAPIGVASLLFTVLLKVDASLLGFLEGGDDNSEVGVYGAAFRLVEGTMFLSWAFGAAMLPWLARHGAGGSGSLARGYQSGLKLTTAVLMPIGLLLVLMASPLVELLYGDGYAAAALPLRLLGAVVVFYGINAFAVTVLIARDRPGRVARIVGAVVVQNIALNLILIPPYGAAGAAFNASLSGALLAALSVWQVTATVGAISLSRAFAGPVVAGSVMTAVVLVSGAPPTWATLLGSAAYLLTLVAFERAAFADDFRLLTEMLRHPGKARAPARAMSSSA